MPGKAFCETVSKGLHGCSDNLTVIIDEFDSFLLQLDESTSLTAQLVCGLKHVYAMTGSDLQPYHLQFIQHAMQGRHINFNKRAIDRREAIQLGCVVNSSVLDYRRQLIEVAFLQTALTPVVIIISESADQVLHGLQRKGVSVFTLL